jgi:hypothetical protein
MNRLQFLERLLATLFGAAVAKHAKPFTECSRGEQGREAGELGFDSSQSSSHYLLSATVAGTPYYDFPEVGPQLLVVEEPEDPPIGVLIPPSLPSFKEFPATLKLEPNNAFDYRAIEVFWGAHKMGYIPRRHNKVLYNLLQDDEKLDAYIRLKHASNGDAITTTHGFEYAYDLRIRVYLLSENA